MRKGVRFPYSPATVKVRPAFVVRISNGGCISNLLFSSRMRKQALSAIFCYASITSVHSAGVSSLIEQAPQSEPDTVVTSLREVEVRENRLEKKIVSSTPFQRIDADIISNSGVTDISDAMRRLAGVNLRDYGGAGGMKTVSVRGLGAAHTGVVYDGVALGDSQTGEIDLSRYTLENMRSVSLYAGENDDIFIPARAAASSASVYISTFDLPGVFDPGFHTVVRLKTGSYSFYNPFVRLDFNSERLASSVNFEYIHAKNNYPFKLKNGSIITTERRENSMMNSWKGEGNLKWRLTPASSLSAKLYYYDNSRELPGPVIYYVTESNEHLHDRNFFGQLNYRGRLADKLSLGGIVKYNWSSTRYEDIGGQYPGGRLDNRYIQRETYASASLLYLPCTGVGIDYSADWFWQNLTSNRNSKGGNGPYRNSILQSLAVKYGNNRLTAMARLLYSIYLNGMKEGEGSGNDSRFSPAVSVSYRPFADFGFFIRASYKNVFRMPTFNEAYFDNYGSLNLKPELTDQFNAGITLSLSAGELLKQLDFTCDGYYNLVKNKIVAIPYNMFLWTMSNMGKVKVAGMDASLTATFSLASLHSILLTGSYTLQRARPYYGTSESGYGKQLAYTPLNSGSVSVSWLNPWVDVAIHGVGSSSRYTTNSNIAETRLGGYWDTGATLSHTFKIKNMKLEAKFELLNIFDRQYEIVARYPMPGRHWKVTLGFDL